MTSDENSAKTEEAFVFPENGKRPFVDPYAQSYKYMPGDEVYILVSGGGGREGPYTIEKAEAGKYTVCDPDGKRLKRGQTFDEKDLEEYNPFE